MLPTIAERQYIEEVALYFERQGLPRMIGRILGWLLICEPAVQSSQDLANALEASKGTISTGTRTLMQMGLIERAALPGERGMHFTISPESWSRLMHSRLLSLTMFRALADRGVAMLADEPASRRARIEVIRDFYAFLEVEFPLLMERWEASRDRK